MLYYLVATIYVLVCFLLLIVVLLQQGKGGDMASAFGGGGSQTAFGARQGATVLSKATAVLGALFMVGAIGLAYLGNRGSSLLGGIAAPCAAGRDADRPDAVPRDARRRSAGGGRGPAGAPARGPGRPADGAARRRDDDLEAGDAGSGAGRSAQAEAVAESRTLGRFDGGPFQFPARLGAGRRRLAVRGYFSRLATMSNSNVWPPASADTLSGISSPFTVPA